ncbi:MAG: NUDIX domain-containing protein [Acidimicrobiales bacterium]
MDQLRPDRAVLAALLEAYRPSSDGEVADLHRVSELVERAADPWSRSEPLHLTASALVVDAGSGRLLLRWHERFGRYQQVGGHGDPGEHDPLEVAIREAREETGLSDLRPVGRAGRLEPRALVHVVIVSVPARADEAAHEHADLRYLLETDHPEEARPETAATPVRWMSWDDAFDLVTNENLQELLSRAKAVLA